MIPVCVAQSARAGDTNAVIPYDTLDDMFQPIAVVDPAKLEIHVLVGSRNKAVHPADITLTIRSAARGMLPVTISTNGLIAAFPHQKDLRRENPPVVSNQPKGTLSLTVTMQLPPSDQLTFRYARLEDGVAEINKAIRAQAGMVLSAFAPKAGGVVFLFPKTAAGKARVEIASVAGRREYTADKDGRVILKLDTALVKENPNVTVSEQPEHIVPDLE
jgi:hypothetical protein